MPVNVGTVEAVLQARDQMSPAIIKAAESVVVLRQAIQDLGNTAPAELAKLQTQLQANEAELERMVAGYNATRESTRVFGAEQANTAATLDKSVETTKAATAATTELSDAQKEGAEAATTYSAGLTQMEGIAARLATRLALLFIIREGFKFVEGIFEANDALLQFSDRTDMSVEKLQEISYAAQQTGVPFEKVTTAIDTLDKKVASGGANINDALHDIGMNLSTVMALPVDQRFDTIAEHIAALPTALQRTKVEVALFGTDAIDPLIMRLKSLEDQARTTNSVAGDDTARALQSTLQIYRDLTSAAETWGTKFVLAALNGSAAIFDMLNVLGKLHDMQQGLTTYWSDLDKRAGIVLGASLTGDYYTMWKALTGNVGGPALASPTGSLPGADDSGSVPGQSTGGKPTGWAFVNSLTSGTAPVPTEDQWFRLKKLQDAGQLNENTAASAVPEWTSAQFKAWLASDNEAEKEWTKWLADTIKLNEELQRVEHGLDAAGPAAEKLGSLGEKAAVKLLTAAQAIAMLQRGGQFGGAAMLEVGSNEGKSGFNAFTSGGNFQNVTVDPVTGDVTVTGDTYLPATNLIGGTPTPNLYPPSLGPGAKPPSDPTIAILQNLERGMSEFGKMTGNEDVKQGAAQLAGVVTAFKGVKEFNLPGADFGDKFGAATSVLLGTLGAGQGGGPLQSILGGALSGASLGPVGAVGGAALGALESIIPLGPDKAELDTRKQRDAFMAQFKDYKDFANQVDTAFGQVGYTADATNAIIGHMLDAKRPEDFKYYLDQINGALEVSHGISTQVDTVVGQIQSKWSGHVIPDAMKAQIEQLSQMNGLTQAERDKLNALTADFRPDFEATLKNANSDIKDITDSAGLAGTAFANAGITLSELGGGFVQGQIEDQFARLNQDILDLQHAGGNIGGILQGLAPTISGLVNQAAQFGVKIPESMKPWIESLANAGQLIDANGKKITDLSTIQWEGTPLDQSMKDVQNAIDHLSDTLSELPMALYMAMQGIPWDQIESKLHPTVTVGVNNGTTPVGPIASITFPITPVGAGAPGGFSGGTGAVPTTSGGGSRVGTAGAFNTAIAASEGGVVVHGGIQHLEGGGRVLPFRYGTDSEMVAMTPGEGVVSVGGMSRLGVKGLAAINHGTGVFGSPSINSTYQVSVALYTGARNGQELLEEVIAPGGVVDVMVRELVSNSNGRGTILIKGLKALSPAA